MDLFRDDDNPGQRDLLDDCIRFHGHLCPGLVIGFKAAVALLNALHIGRDTDEELFAIVETDACGSDAIQVVTGCTFGKGNFLFLNHGKHACSLASREQDKAFRACLRWGVQVFSADQLALAEKVRTKTATKGEWEDFLAARTTVSRRLLAMEDAELLTLREVRLPLPPRARILRSEPCSRCGEPTRCDLLQQVGDAMLCSSCVQGCHPLDKSRANDNNLL